MKRKLFELRKLVDDAAFADERGGNVSLAEKRLFDACCWRLMDFLLNTAEELEHVKGRMRGDCKYCKHKCEQMSVPYRSCQGMDAANWEFSEGNTK
jgi:hypothetical protein